MWCGLLLSLLGRIHLVNTPPSLLYCFQMLPIWLPKIGTTLNGSIITFIWCNKRPRLRYNFLCLPAKRGGLAAPSFPLYLWAAQCRFLREQCIDDPDSVWLSCESVGLGLYGICYVSSARAAELVKYIMLLKNMLIWCKIRKLKGYTKCFSLLTPIHENVDFQPGLGSGFADWEHRGINVVGDMIQGESILTFQQIKIWCSQ